MITRSSSNKSISSTKNSPSVRGRGKNIGNQQCSRTLNLSDTSFRPAPRVVHSPPAYSVQRHFIPSNPSEVTPQSPIQNSAPSTATNQELFTVENHPVDSRENPSISESSVSNRFPLQDIDQPILLGQSPSTTPSTRNNIRNTNSHIQSLGTSDTQPHNQNTVGDFLTVNLLETSIANLSHSSLENLLPPTGFIEKHNRLQAHLDMEASNNNTNTEVDPNSLQNILNIDSLLSSLKQTILDSQAEFRSEINSLRDTISHISNERSQNAGSTVSGSHTTPSNFSTNVRKPPDLKDWKVNFDGTGSVSDFLFKLETLSQRNQCNTDFLLSNFQIFLSGKAETWYWLFVKQNKDYTYPYLCYAITKEFGNLESDHEVLMRISLRKQHAKESYDEFHASLVGMNLRMQDPITERSLIKIIKSNVNPSLKMMLFASEPKTLEDLRDVARKAERLIRENKSQTGISGPSKHINEIDIASEKEDNSDLDIDPQVEAFSLPRSSHKADYSKIKCWNCLNFGHSYIYCPDEKRNVFCFKCGQPGVVTTKCPNSHLGNYNRNEKATGDSRYQK